MLAEVVVNLMTGEVGPVTVEFVSEQSLRHGQHLLEIDVCWHDVDVRNGQVHIDDTAFGIAIRESRYKQCTPVIREG